MKTMAAGRLTGPVDRVVAEPFEAFYRANSERVYRAPVHRGDRVRARHRRGHGQEPVAGTGCRIRVFDLTSAGLRKTFSIPTRNCGPIQLSPDGRRIAAPYKVLHPDGTQDWRIAIADTGTGEVRADKSLVVIPAPDPAISVPGPQAQGIAWVDADTVRVSWGEPRRATRVSDLRVATVTVQ